VPDERPSEKIAKLFPQTDPSKDQKNAAPAVMGATTNTKNAVSTGTPPAKGATPAPVTSTAQATTATTVPLPEARPATAPAPEKPRRRPRRYRY
jgi:membrane-bound lytic murein transglycosylase A